MEAGAEGAAATGGDILRGEPSKKKSLEESLAESWSFLDKELEEFKKICDELDNGEFLVSCLSFYNKNLLRVASSHGLCIKGATRFRDFLCRNLFGLQLNKELKLKFPIYPRQ